MPDYDTGRPAVNVTTPAPQPDPGTLSPQEYAHLHQTLSPQEYAVLQQSEARLEQAYWQEMQDFVADQGFENGNGSVYITQDPTFTVTGSPTQIESVTVSDPTLATGIDLSNYPGGELPPGAHFASSLMSRSWPNDAAPTANFAYSLLQEVSPSGSASLHSMDYNEAERAVRAIEASAAVIKEIGDDVNGKVALLNANDFKGKAGDSYQAAFHKWHKGYSIIRQNLITLGEKMAEANDGLQYEEANLAAANASYEAPDQQVY
ncbi:MAG: WXG100 family type VII secretion target [Angustibacter sp.]